MKSTDKSSLSIDKIMLLVNPFSELGRKAKKHFTPFSFGDEKKARDYFAQLSKLLLLIKSNPEAITYIGSILSHFPQTKPIIEASHTRHLEIHEIYEIKSFLFHYKKLCGVLTKKDLDVIPRHDFDTIFQMLDIDGQQTPSFHISTRYSPLYADLKAKTHSLLCLIEKNIAEQKKNIVNAQNIKNIQDTFTISRMDTELKQTLLDSGFFYIEDENFANITLKIKKSEEILALEHELKQINAEVSIEVKNILSMLTSEIKKSKSLLLSAQDDIGHFDLLFAKAIFAKAHTCTIPEILHSDSIEGTIPNHDNQLFAKGEQCFDILTASELQKMGIVYQKVNIDIMHTVNIITGCNMGGKTSFLKTIGQIAQMAKAGMPVPGERVSIRLFDHVYFSGASSHEDRVDLSSFGVEVVTLQNVLTTTGKNLLLLDEFARGTNPTEGQSLYHSVIRHFVAQADTLLVSATHYPPPQDFDGFSHFQMIGLDRDFIESTQKSHSLTLIEKLQLIHKYMNYQPIRTTADHDMPMSALHIAELLGLDSGIVKEARKKIPSKNVH
jgi:dsDNA-specific endonuclease/ATPase MutS2